MEATVKAKLVVRLVWYVVGGGWDFSRSWRWDSNSEKNWSGVMGELSFLRMASDAAVMPAFSSRRVPMVSKPITLKLESDSLGVDILEGG